MSDLTLEAVTPADRQEWAALWTAYLDFYGTTLTADAFDAAFAQLLSDDPASFSGLIARQDGAARGLVHWVWHPHMWRPKGTVYLQDLFVAPDMRGRGLGGRLIQAVRKAARARGVDAVYWMTNADNPARVLYDRVATRTDFIKYQVTP